MLTVDLETWVIADTHFGHHNIIKYCNRPRNHDSLMLRNWKKKVKRSDTVLHLGDVMVWYPYSTAIAWAVKVRKLPGQKFLIKGNHDEDQKWSDKFWLDTTGMTIVPQFRQKEVLFSHEAVQDEALWQLNIHGHSHNHAPPGFYSRMGYNYYNASIEGMGYKPVKLGEILEQVTNNDMA